MRRRVQWLVANMDRFSNKSSLLRQMGSYCKVTNGKERGGEMACKSVGLLQQIAKTMSSSPAASNSYIRQHMKKVTIHMMCSCAPQTL